MAIKAILPIDVELLKETFVIDYENGCLLYKKDIVYNGRIYEFAGTKAGYVAPRGYIIVNLKRKKYKAHRLIWVLHYGEDIPEGMQIDHKDRITSNNKIENLRLVSNRENQQNTAHHASGRLLGTYLDKRKGTWQANIRFNGKNIYLGNFKTELLAHQAYMAKYVELGFSNKKPTPKGGSQA